MAIGSARPLWARQVACASRGTASRSVLPSALRSAVIIGDGWAFRLAVILSDGDPFVRAAILTLREFRESRRSELERVVHPGRSGRGCRRIAWLRGMALTFRMKSICDLAFINIVDLGHYLLSVTCKQSTTHLGICIKASGRPLRLPPALSRVRLLSFVGLDRFLNRPLHSVQVEGRGRLHRRIVDRRFRQLRYLLLYHDEAPELASHEVVQVAAAHVIQGLAPDRRRALEWILPDVGDGGHIRRHLLARPAKGLLIELELEVVDPEGAQMWPTEIEELMARRGPLAQQQIHLVIAI